MARKEYKVSFYEHASYEVFVEAESPEKAAEIVENADWEDKPVCTGIHDRGVNEVELVP